jgi:hypothetical protein
MERTDILELMSTLKLFGMRAACDEVMTTAKCRPQRRPVDSVPMLPAQRRMNDLVGCAGAAPPTG